MAYTDLTATSLAFNTCSADLPVTAGTAIDATKTMRVAYPREGKLVLVVNNTTAGAKILTVSAGGYHSAGQGALTQSFAQDDVRFLVVSSDRLKQQNGYVYLTFETSMTGYVLAFSLPY